MLTSDPYTTLSELDDEFNTDDNDFDDDEEFGEDEENYDEDDYKDPYERE